jgi:starvation-inducible DNA-binding protein
MSITTSLSDAARKTAGDALQDTLAELLHLVLTGKQLHWNLVGPRFRSIHLQLDEVVGLARAHADTVAERAAAIGVNPDGRAATVAALKGVDKVEPGWVKDDDVVRTAATTLRDFADRLRARIETTEEADPVTQDLLIAVCHDLDKQAWMFQAHLS